MCKSQRVTGLLVLFVFFLISKVFYKSDAVMFHFYCCFTSVMKIYNYFTFFECCWIFFCASFPWCYFFPLLPSWSVESVIELTNISSDPVHWKIQAFAPAYVKGADENNTVQRVGYSVFQIIPISGDLLPHESSKVSATRNFQKTEKFF